jgi:hypothetical protein
MNSTALMNSTVFVDCTRLTTCSDCLAEWSCVWCTGHDEAASTGAALVSSNSSSNSTSTLSETLSIGNHSHSYVRAHCAPGRFYGPVNSTVEQCPRWEYRLCGVDGWLTLTGASIVVVVFLLVLACLCWCCWSRRRGPAASGGGGMRAGAYSARASQQRFSSLERATMQTAPSSSDMRRKLLVDADDDGDDDIAFRTTPTPISDSRRREMTLKWGIGSASGQGHQTAIYSSEPSRSPAPDAVYFSSIN